MFYCRDATPSRRTEARSIRAGRLSGRSPGALPACAAPRFRSTSIKRPIQRDQPPTSLSAKGSRGARFTADSIFDHSCRPEPDIGDRQLLAVSWRPRAAASRLRNAKRRGWPSGSFGKTRRAGMGRKPTGCSQAQAVARAACTEDSSRPSPDARPLPLNDRSQPLLTFIKRFERPSWPTTLAHLQFNSNLPTTIAGENEPSLR
jgi:hypothetical protein